MTNCAFWSNAEIGLKHRPAAAIGAAPAPAAYQRAFDVALIGLCQNILGHNYTRTSKTKLIDRTSLKRTAIARIAARCRDFVPNHWPFSSALATGMIEHGELVFDPIHAGPVKQDQISGAHLLMKKAAAGPRLVAREYTQAANLLKLTVLRPCALAA